MSYGGFCQLPELLVRQFALGFQIVAYQVKSPKLQHPLLRLAGIQLTYTASCQIPWICVITAQTQIDLLKILP